MNVYSNLAHKRRTKKDSKSRKKAEYLATLPKHPVKRTIHRMHPKRVASFWFSREGATTLLKIAGVATLVGVLMVGALFAYYRKDIDQIRPSELAKRVQTTVTRYYDRNDKLLWEDKGDGDYKLVVDGEDIAKTMKQATIAIEDKNFYNHRGVSPTGLIRAAINNSRSESVQGGSTLTQQLVKQVFFADEASKRGLNGIPRKIKEVILAVEVERMYNKEQILNLYLNESPYGGRRNGVESAAQTYFGKTAKKLTLAESALLAAIPNQPGVLDPYYTPGNEALISRQHAVLDKMVDEDFITKEQANKAKSVAILDTIQSETSQYKNIKAPHFVQMVRSELERKLGKATVGRGGLTVKTTVDLRIQNKLESAMKDMFKGTNGVNCYGIVCPQYAGFSNGAATFTDVKTGQIIAMVGSRSFNYPGFGQDNAATAFIQPGSSIKPFVYAQLFKDKGEDNQNFGSGSILSDSPISFGGYKPQNADGGYKGNIDIRDSLAQSRNIPALKAMQVSGVEPTLKTIRKAGNTFYCTQGAEKQAGLSAAIGGCGTRMIDHANALGTLARGGVYMPTSTVISVKNNNGDELEKYKKSAKRVIDEQPVYIVSDILSDTSARQKLFGRSITPKLEEAGIKSAIKTGTSDKNREAKDIWTVGYTPSISGAVWLGNPDTTPLTNGNSSIPAQVLDPVMAYATQIYQKEDKAKTSDWFKRPKGIQEIRGELYPSWYDKKKTQSGVKLKFDKISKKRATKCTPEDAIVEVSVLKMTDPITKKSVYVAPSGYDASNEDDVHSCDDSKPSINGISVENGRIAVRVTRGTFGLDSLTISVNGSSIATINVGGSGTYSTSYDFTGKNNTVTATLEDKGNYTDSQSKSFRQKAGNNKDNKKNDE